MDKKRRLKKINKLASDLGGPGALFRRKKYSDEEWHERCDLVWHKLSELVEAEIDSDNLDGASISELYEALLPMAKHYLYMRLAEMMGVLDNGWDIERDVAKRLMATRKGV